MSRHIPIMREDPFWAMSPVTYSSPFTNYSERFYDSPSRSYGHLMEPFPLERRNYSYRTDGVDENMRKMTEEMNRMVNNMQRLAPLGSTAAPSVDDLRLSENFRLENPIKHEFDGSRKFHLQFDVRQFRPEEINVKTSGNQLTVHAKHEEKDNGKSVFREYHRQFILPKDVRAEDLRSKLTAHGCLEIEAPLPSLPSYREKIIPIDRK